MMRGDVYDARLNPVEGSEQKGSRPVVIVSRNAINTSSTIVVVFLARPIDLGAACIPVTCS